MSEKQKQQLFYAVSYGNQPGIYDNYKDAKSATKGFPEPVLKKFEKREEAEEFLKKSQPESTSYEAKENDTDGKFYAVARGRVIGIFKDMDTVKKNISGFPNSKHKKFNTFGEAKSYVEKYAEGKVGEKTPKKRARQADDEEGDDVAVKAVARKRTSGRVGETDESDVGEHMDQTHTSTEENNITTSTTDDGNNTSAENAQEKTTEGEDATKQTAQVEENGDKEKGVEEGKNPETATEEDAAEKNTEEESVEPAKHMEQ